MLGDDDRAATPEGERRATANPVPKRRSVAVSVAVGWILLATAAGAREPGAARIATRTLESRAFHNHRTLRVLLPPSYDTAHGAALRYPVFYFTDGIAAFDAWGVPEVLERLWTSGAIPELIAVGIDNGGSTTESNDAERDRAGEYLRYPVTLRMTS